ncbi:MAG: hypothetical protein AB7O38_14480 [Pirellulaceae bacterium]
MVRKNTETPTVKNVSRATKTAKLGEVVPTAELVRCRAFEIYQERCHNGVWGDALADWVAAERELTACGDEDSQTVRTDRAINGA